MHTCYSFAFINLLVKPVNYILSSCFEISTPIFAGNTRFAPLKCTGKRNHRNSYSFSRVTSDLYSTECEYLDEHVANKRGLDVGRREADLSRLPDRKRQVRDERCEILEVLREAHEVLIVVQRTYSRVQLLCTRTQTQ